MMIVKGAASPVLPIEPCFLNEASSGEDMPPLRLLNLN